VAAEQEAGANPLGLLFPSLTGKLWRASNFQRNVLARAYRKAGWRDAKGEGRWVWHSLRHVFRSSTTAPSARERGSGRIMATCARVHSSTPEPPYR
jgi:hypothetical protein